MTRMRSASDRPPPRARATRAGSRGPCHAPRRGDGGRTRSRRRRGRASAAPRSDAGVAADLARRTTFCWLPPESARPGRRAAAAHVELAQQPPRPRDEAPGRASRSASSASAKSWGAMFSARVKSRMRPRRWRSSGMWPIPRRACRALSFVIHCPRRARSPTRRGGARQRLDELPLAVPVHAGDRDDLAAVHREADAAHGLKAALVEHVQVVHARSCSPGVAALLDLQEHLRPTIRRASCPRRPGSVHGDSMRFRGAAR